jgi:glycosyltransferase involved in cell wall biosynthesis
MSGRLPQRPRLLSVPVSVVLPTYRRPQLLERCLRALLAQDLELPYEIVVADDGPDAATEQLVARLAQECGPHQNLSYLPVTATQGPAGARNCGWRAAAGEVIAFTDDDTIPAADWLRQGLAAMETGQAAIAGTVQVPLPSTPTDYERDASGLERAEFVTANCFVRHSALEAVGGFDERFTAAWREDSDLQFRLLQAYGPRGVGLALRARVVHPVRPASWGVSLRQQRKSMFDALLFKKHPLLYRRRIQSRPLWRYYLMVGSALLGTAALAAGWKSVALAALGLWLLLTLRFCLLRLRGTSHRPRHVAEMALTSALIPFLSLYWRLAGALRWRVLFV